MERFSTRRFLELILILGIGVGIGAGLDMLLRPTRIIMAAAPVLAAPAPPRIPSPAAPQPAQVANLSCSASATLENNLYPSLMLSFGSLAPEFTHCLTIEIRNAPVGRPCQLRIDSGLLQEPFQSNWDPRRFVSRECMPFDAAEEQRRAADPEYVVPAGDTAGDFGHFQAGIDLGIDRGQFPTPASSSRKSANVRYGMKSIVTFVRFQANGLKSARPALAA